MLTRFDATEFSNVSHGAPTLEMGIAFLHEKTGLSAIPMPTSPDDPNWSAILHTHSGAVIEVVAPNPDHRGLDHLRSELARLTVPQLVVWSVQTPDFDAVAAAASALDHPVEQVVAHQFDRDGYKQSFKLGRLGPGENMIRPFVTGCDFPLVYPERPDPECLATALHLTTWDAPPINRLLAGLGLDLRAQSGPPSLRLD